MLAIPGRIATRHAPEVLKLTAGDRFTVLVPLSHVSACLTCAV